jgi:hypothetical protein
MYSDRIQNMGHSYSILPVHQVRTIGLIKGAYKQTMKSLTKAACAPPSQNSRQNYEGKRDQIIRLRHMGY